MLKRFKLQFPKKWLKKCQKPASSATFVHLRPNRCRLEHSATPLEEVGVGGAEERGKKNTISVIT